MHTDNVSITNPELWIANLDYQLAINIYVKMPSVADEGKIVTVNSDETDLQPMSRFQKSFGYSLDMINGHDKCELRPQLGDMVIFNSRLWHGVTNTSEPRSAIHGFIGINSQEPKKLYFWS